MNEFKTMVAFYTRDDAGLKVKSIIARLEIAGIVNMPKRNDYLKIGKVVYRIDDVENWYEIIDGSLVEAYNVQVIPEAQNA